MPVATRPNNAKPIAGADADPSSEPPADQSRSNFRLLRRLLVFASIPPMLAVIASFFGEHFFVSELLVNFQLQLAIILSGIAILLFCFAARRWAGVTMLTACASIIPLALALTPTVNPPAGPNQIKLMSFNVFAVNPTMDAAIDCIKEHDPDVVLVIEYANTWKKHVDTLLEFYPYRVDELRWHGFGIVLLSKFELSETQVVQTVNAATDAPLIISTIKVGDQEVRLFAAHLLAPMDPMRMDFRNQQLVEIADLIGDSSKQPTILVGDFNCVPWSSHMQRLLQQTELRDTRRGIGYHASWPTDRFFMRIPIDHAFVSDHIHVKSRKLLGQTGSDHFPVLVEFSITK